MNLDIQLSKRVRALRKSAGYSLEQLAERSGVSRSMISLIERAETSATAAALNKLADALGVSLASLFSEIDPATASPLMRAANQTVWRDPESGYSRRQLSPVGMPTPITLTEVHFPAGQRVVFDQVQQTIQAHQQIWLLAGEMEIVVDGQTWRLSVGDCLAMTMGAQVIFYNPGSTVARYVLAFSTLPNRQG